jgi:hypothetical protein
MSKHFIPKDHPSYACIDWNHVHLVINTNSTYGPNSEAYIIGNELKQYIMDGMDKHGDEFINFSTFDAIIAMKFINCNYEYIVINETNNGMRRWWYNDNEAIMLIHSNNGWATIYGSKDEFLIIASRDGTSYMACKEFEYYGNKRESDISGGLDFNGMKKLMLIKANRYLVDN